MSSLFGLIDRIKRVRSGRKADPRRSLTDDQMAEIAERYREGHRSYHTNHHLSQMYRALGQLSEGGEKFDLTLLHSAIMLHDAVYEIGSSDNESESAKLALEMIPDQDVAAEVHRLIMLTLDHRVDPMDQNGAVLVDADLSILGASEQRYSVYVDQVREEYGSIRDEVFIPGRISAMESFLEREHIFSTKTGRTLWEESARRNIRSEIDGWKRKLSS